MVNHEIRTVFHGLKHQARITCHLRISANPRPDNSNYLISIAFPIVVCSLLPSGDNISLRYTVLTDSHAWLMSVMKSQVDTIASL
jgi:hypothetical protein